MDSFYFLFSSQHSLVTRCWGYRAKSGCPEWCPSPSIWLWEEFLQRPGSEQLIPYSVRSQEEVTSLEVT